GTDDVERGRDAEPQEVQRRVFRRRHDATRLQEDLGRDEPVLREQPRTLRVEERVTADDAQRRVQASAGPEPEDVEEAYAERHRRHRGEAYQEGATRATHRRRTVVPGPSRSRAG